MSRLLVAPIVEGDGEVACVRILLERIGQELLGGAYIQVLKPTLLPRGQLKKPDRLQNFVGYAIKKLNHEPKTTDPSLILILADADEACPKELAPRLLEIARAVDTRVDMACVLAKFEYETWFAAAAESLSKYLDLSLGSPPSESPEEARHKKLWVEQRFRGNYGETQDQPAMTRAMDLARCRERAPSFAKLCRDLEQSLRRSVPGA